MEVLVKLDSPVKVFVASVPLGSKERTVVQVDCNAPLSIPGLILCLKFIFHPNTKRIVNSYVIYEISIIFFRFKAYARLR